MLKVEIYNPYSSTWTDHAGKRVDRLTFVKDWWRAGLFPGHYPLESLGSVYRNIDNFCESPLQSRMEWEIRIPMIYSSKDGKFRTNDLLYFLESINEHDFDLIGCEAVLSEGDRIFYSGVVESIQNGNGTASIRISDWLGNPKIGKSDFPVSIGTAEVYKWKPVVTQVRNILNIEISSQPLLRPPVFYLKSGEKFVPVEGFMQRGADSVCSVEYSSGYMSATIRARGIQHGTLPEDIGPDDEILLPVPSEDPWSVVTRWRLIPGFYSIGENDDFEPLTAWVNGFWMDPSQLAPQDTGILGALLGTQHNDKLLYPLGRAERSKRRAHRKGDAIFRIEEFNLDAIVDITLFADSMYVMSGSDRQNVVLPPYATGSLAQFASNSRTFGGDGGGTIDWEQCPRFLPVSRQDFSAEKNCWNYDKRFNIQVYMSEADVPDDAKIIPYVGRLQAYLKSAIAPPFYYSLPSPLNNLANGALIQCNYYFTSGMTTVGDLRTLAFPIDFRCLRKPTAEEFQAIDALQVGAIRLRTQARVQVDINNLYVSAPSYTSSSAAASETGRPVKPVVEALLEMGYAQGEVSVSGETDGLHYGTIINREAFALRDKLRSLAAESATLVRFSPNAKEIILSDISLKNELEHVFIPLEAFLLENNAYYFGMESSDKNEILIGVDIHWGKDIETGKYAHTFSVDIAGIMHDGEQAGPCLIELEKWSAVSYKIEQNLSKGINLRKSIDSEWIASWEAAEKLAYNVLRWNSARLRKANARLILSVLDSLKPVDIGTFVSFDLPGYPKKFSETMWVVTGRQDDFDSMVTTLELLQASDLPAAPPNRCLLLEDGRNLLLENSGKIKLEDYYG